MVLPQSNKMADIRQSTEYANYLAEIGWIVEKNDGAYYFIKKLPFIGSVIKNQRPEKINLSKIEGLRKKYRAFQIILEPKDKKQEILVKNNGFKLSKSPYLPTKTLQLDLTLSKQKLFNNLKKDCKHEIRRSVKYCLKNIKNTEEFRNEWKKAIGLKRYVPPISHLIALKKSFKNNCIFLMTSLSTEVSAKSGAIFLRDGEVAYYWQAFTNKSGRKSKTQYKIVWEGILWAKKNRAKVFDFEGIYDERFPNKSWLGFTHFKKSFGGYEVGYPGCYTKTRFPYL